LLTENTPILIRLPRQHSILILNPHKMVPTQIHQNPSCPICACKLTVKKGVRRNRLQTLQVFRCTECLHRFTGAAGKNKTYPLHLILETVSTFNLGYSLTETQRVMRGRYHREIPERTISSWLKEYRPLSTYSRLRLACRKLFRPETLISSHTFHHQRVYRFQVHQAKLNVLTQEAMERRLRNLTHPRWIEAVTTLIYRSKDRYFRWHDSGDLQSIEHLRKIVAVRKNLPRVKFWLPTREYQTIDAYRRMGGRIPSNLCIRLSAHLINGKLPLGYGLPVSTVSSHKNQTIPSTHRCPAARQGNTCGRCRACWNPTVKVVEYPLK